MIIVITLCIIVVIFFTGVAIFGNYKAAEVQDVERPDTRNVRISFVLHSRMTFHYTLHTLTLKQYIFFSVYRKTMYSMIATILSVKAQGIYTGSLLSMPISS